MKSSRRPRHPQPPPPARRDERPLAMKDLYRHLNLTESASDAEIRAALPAADPDTRDAATMLLLDPGRRAVYDRNRRTVATIGRLRAHLGLNLTRFWPRSRFADFTVDLNPPPPGRPRVVMDPAAVAWAFGVQPERRRSARRRRIGAFLIVILLIALLAAAVLLFLRR